MDRRDFYYNSGDEHNSGYIDPEEYRKMRYFKNYHGYENYPQGYSQKENSETEETAPEKKTMSHPVLLFQVIICLLAAIAVFAVKSIGGELYGTVKEYYDRYINTQDIITDFFSDNMPDIVQQERDEDNTENFSSGTEESAETSSGDTNE